MKNDNPQNKIIYQLLSSRKKRIILFKKLPENQQGFVLLKLSPHIQKEILEAMKNPRIISMLNYLDPDEATDLLQNIEPSRRKRIISGLNKEIKEKVEFLIKFDPRIAAGIMSLDYVEVNKNTTFKEVSKIVHEHEKRTGKFPTILVVDKGFLLGEIPGPSIILAKSTDKVGKYTEPVPHIKYDKKEDEIIKLFKEKPHNKIIVLDENKSILGVIYSDDILKLIERHSTANLRSFAGVRKEEDVLDPPLVKVKHRYKWLIINLATAFLAASVVSMFQKTISAFVLLAVYMPIVAGMGGNAGTQTLAVVVRGMALGEVNKKTGKKILSSEVIAGIINGFIDGVLVAAVAILWNKNPLLGLVVGISMVSNLFIAGFFGTLVPMIMRKLGKDPASSATIFITTATDVFGFFVFLGLASIILV